LSGVVVPYNTTDKVGGRLCVPGMGSSLGV